MEALGTRIKVARERLGMAVREVHELTGISPAVLYGYEAGKTKPGAREIALISEALRVTPNVLLFGSEEPFGVPALDPASRLARMTDERPFALMASVMIIPMALATMDYEDRRTLFSVALSLIQAKQPDIGPKIVRAVQAMDDFMTARGLTWDKLSKMSKEQRDALMAEMQAAFESKNQSNDS